jgi:putative ABC transport system ATP-binding protein
VYGSRETAVHALRDVTLTIPRSAFTAIMGPSGSGKSTLLHCLAALDTPTSGRVFLGGTELTALSRRQQAQVRRDRIGFVFQSFNLVPTLDALENITLPQLLAGRRPDRAWLHHVIARVGLEDRLHHRPSELSGGQQQRIALARALAGRPEVIFADEPTGNLDTTASHEMLTLLRDAVDQFDQTVVTVTHDPSIASYADQILYFSDGRVVDRAARPDADHVSRPRHDQGVESGNGRHDHRFPARRRADGQQTMRSRRRRQPEEPAPGRPMVGSDDEVEVARQERWLRRIREQFEAEYTTLEDTDPEASTGDHPSVHDTIQQPTQWSDDQAHWTDHDPRPRTSGPYDDQHHPATGHTPGPYDDQHHPATGHTPGPSPDTSTPYDDHVRRQATSDTYDDHLRRQATADTYGDVRRADASGYHGGRQAPDLPHTDVQPRQEDDGAGRHDLGRDDPQHARAPFHHAAADANGWLPPERAQLYTAPYTGAPEERGVDPGADRWREDAVTPSEIAPWSRPAHEAADEHELTQPTETPGWRVTGDPWAPPDEHLAEEYHSEQSTSRRGQSWQHDSGDVWSTGRWEAQAEDTAGEERVVDESRDADQPGGSARHDTDGHTVVPAPMPDDVERPVRQVDDGSDDVRVERWRHDDHAGDEATAATNGSYRNGRHTDAAPPTVNGHDRDPWTDVWDAPAGPGSGEVWTPTFDRSSHVNGNGRAVSDAQDVGPSPGEDAEEVPSDGLRAGDAPWSPPADDLHAEPDPMHGERTGWVDDRGASAIDPPHDDATVGGTGAPETQGGEEHVRAPDDPHGVDAPVEPRDDDSARDAAEHPADGQPPAPPVANDTIAPQAEQPGEADVAAAPHVEPATHDVPDPGAVPQVAADPEPVSGDSTVDSLAAPSTEVAAARPASEPLRDEETAAHHQPETPVARRRVGTAAAQHQPHSPAAPDPRHRPDAPVARTRPEPTTPASARRSDASVPPPLASLRNTRRPDEWRDPMEALQSLQDQLDRLGGTGRRGRRPRRAGSGDTDPRER